MQYRLWIVDNFTPPQNYQLPWSSPHEMSSDADSAVSYSVISRSNCQANVDKSYATALSQQASKRYAQVHPDYGSSL